MKLGLDLDGVVYDFVGGYHRWLVECGFDPRHLTRPVLWNCHGILGFTQEEFIQQCDEGVDAGRIFTTERPLPGARDFIWEHKDAGHEIHFITARNFGSRSEELTYSWLNDWGISYDSVTFSQDKTVVECDIYVDDHVRNVDAVIATGREAFVLYDPPRLDQIKHPRFVSGWPQLREIVKQIEQEAPDVDGVPA